MLIRLLTVNFTCSRVWTQGAVNYIQLQLSLHGSWVNVHRLVTTWSIPKPAHSTHWPSTDRPIACSEAGSSAHPYTDAAADSSLYHGFIGVARIFSALSSLKNLMTFFSHHPLLHVHTSHLLPPTTSHLRRCTSANSAPFYLIPTKMPRNFCSTSWRGAPAPPAPLSYAYARITC